MPTECSIFLSGIALTVRGLPPYPSMAWHIGVRDITLDRHC